jgi:hypothetical protein
MNITYATLFPDLDGFAKSLKHIAEFVSEPLGEDAPDRDLFQVGVNALVTHLSGVPGIARSSKRSKVPDT